MEKTAKNYGVKKPKINILVILTFSVIFFGCGKKSEIENKTVEAVPAALEKEAKTLEEVGIAINTYPKDQYGNLVKPVIKKGKIPDYYVSLNSQIMFWAETGAETETAEYLKGFAKMWGTVYKNQTDVPQYTKEEVRKLLDEMQENQTLPVDERTGNFKTPKMGITAPDYILTVNGEMVFGYEDEYTEKAIEDYAVLVHEILEIDYANWYWAHKGDDK